jgi:hypothetical protein
MFTGSQGVHLRRHSVYTGVALERSVVPCDVIATCCVARHGAVRLGMARPSTSRGSKRHGVNTASPIVA